MEVGNPKRETAGVPTLVVSFSVVWSLSYIRNKFRDIQQPA